MNHLINYFLFLVTALIGCAFQCSLWMQVLGSFPPPQIWTPFLVYWALYRQPVESVFMIYGLALLSASLSAMPFSILLLEYSCLFLALFTLKQRILWSGATFFMMATGAATLAFPVLHFIVSWLVETNPIHHLELFHWALSALINMLLALLFFRFFGWLDRITHKETPTEAGRELP